MKPTSDTVFCVVDHGQFMSVAMALGKVAKRVFYACPKEQGCPVIKDGILGDGFSQFEKVNSLWEAYPQTDVFVFPDIGFEDEQIYLRDNGNAVWGSGRADSLESNRGLFLKTIEELGLPVPHYETIQGITNLRLFLRDATDKYIKISRWRGDFETFHWRDWDSDNYVLDTWAVIFGPVKEFIKFYVLDSIPTRNEDGIDLYCVDGKLPTTVMHGSENKDKSFVGGMQRYDETPEPIRRVCDRFMEHVTVQFGYRGPFSVEVRTTDDGEPYFIDFTARYPSPPHQLQIAMWDNFGDIINAGAHGELADPEPNAQFGVQAVLTTERDENEWASMKLPESLKECVWPMYACEIEDVYQFPPGGMGHMLAWLTGTGDTLEEAIAQLQEYKAELPDGIECHDKSISEVLGQIKDAQKDGTAFTDQKVPEPEIVLQDE